MATLKDIIRDMLIRNELSGNVNKAYTLQNAGTSKSGYSFGQPQWDLANNSTERDTFTAILTNAKGADNYLIFDTDKNGILDENEEGIIEELTKIVAIKNTNLTIEQKNYIESQKSLVDNALSSTYGKQEINTAYETHLDNEITRLDTLYSELEGAGRQDVADYIRGNTLMQMMLIDFDNQFGISGIDGNQVDPANAKLLQFLKTGETAVNYGTNVKVEGDFDIIDYLKFVFSTKYAHDFNANGVNDLLRRFCNTVKTFQEYGEVPLTAEEQKIVEGLKALYGLNISSRELFEKVHKFFTTAAPLPNSSPIILDLDGDGVETTHIKDGAYFDHDGNGFNEQTGWAGADDGILVRDINGNGAIDDGKELFGNQTILEDGTTAANGFQALADLDDNLDGKIDAGDAAWTSLKVWQDVDGDGFSAADEFHTLDELGIQSINTGYVDSTFIDAQGNEHRQIGSFTKTDGTTGTATDVWFLADKAYTIATEWLDVPPEIAALPDLQGYGNVYDLHQAMVRDTSGELKALVESFVAETDSNVRDSLMEQILFKWTGSDGVDPASQSWFGDARKLAAMGALFGETYTGSIGVAAVSLLNQAYHGLFEMFRAQLMAQTHLKDLYGTVTYTWDEATENVKGDLTAVAAEIQNRLTLDPEAGKQALSEFVRTLRGFAAEDMMDFMTFRSPFALQSEELAWIVDTAGKYSVTGTVALDTLNGTTGGDAVYGYESGDVLYGHEGDDTLYGGDGNDSLYGGADSDVLTGGAGNDYLSGEAGNDIYRFGLGSGQDTIYEYDVTNIDINTVEFGAGITSADLELVKAGTNLKINILGTTDSLTLTSWFSSDYYKIEQFKLADGTVLTPAGLDAIGYKVYGTAGIDYLYGSSAGDTMYGYEGNDSLTGYAGNDTLYGGAGDDLLYGGVGNDTYRFGLGSGMDIISDYDATPGNTDTVQFDVNPLDLIFAQSGYNLNVTVNGTTDQIAIQNWSLSTNYQTEVFQTADGSALLNSQVGQLIQAMATFSADTGISWSQAIQDRPQDVQQILAQYWTPPQP
ncbi:MAG: calcium-binding protein [Thermodesulfobacteriota bacterium]